MPTATRETVDVPEKLAAPMATAELRTMLAKPLSDIAADPVLLERLRLDLSVSAETPQMPVERVTFTITLSPGILDVVRPTTTLSIPVLIIDEFGNSAVDVCTLKSKGDAVTKTIELPIRDRSGLSFPDPGRTVFVIADPLGTVAERNEFNNFARTYVYSLG